MPPSSYVTSQLMSFYDFLNRRNKGHTPYIPYISLIFRLYFNKEEIRMIEGRIKERELEWLIKTVSSFTNETVSTVRLKGLEPHDSRHQILSLARQLRHSRKLRCKDTINFSTPAIQTYFLMIQLKCCSILNNYAKLFPATCALLGGIQSHAEM